MNRQNVQRTIDYLRALPDNATAPGFDMQMWLKTRFHARIDPDELRENPAIVHECGTTACIAGHIVVGFCEELGHFFSYEGAATRFLNLEPHEATRLFYGEFKKPGQDLHNITLDQAIAELERMLTDA